MAKESQKGHLYVHVDGNDFLFSLTVKLITTTFQVSAVQMLQWEHITVATEKTEVKKKRKLQYFKPTIIFLYTLSSSF